MLINSMGIESRMSSKFGNINRYVMELTALECQKKPIFDLVRSITCFLCCLDDIDLMFLQTGFKFAGN